MALKNLISLVGKEDAIRIIVKKLGYDGGPGSGNFGHKGRPGEVGGSGPGGGEKKDYSPEEIKNTLSEIEDGWEAARRRVDERMNWNYFARYMNGIMYGQGKGHDAIMSYSFHGDGLMNSLLRELPPKNYEIQKERKESVSETIGNINALTEVCSANRLVKPAIVFRGIGNKGLVSIFGSKGLTSLFGLIQKPEDLNSAIEDSDFGKSLIGATFSDPAFVSTSVDEEVPRKAGFASACQMEIYLPAGTQGVYLGDQGRFTDESEYIIQRGTQFVVTDCEQKTLSTGKRILKMKVVALSQNPTEIPKLKDAFPEPREEIMNTVKGEPLETERLYELFPNVPHEYLEEINQIRNGTRTMDTDDRLWNIIDAQFYLGNVDETEASELQSYGMNLDRSKDYDSYKRKKTEFEKTLKELSENETLNSEVKSSFPNADKSVIPILLSYQDELDRVTKSAKRDVEVFGREGSIYQMKLRTIKGLERIMEDISKMKTR